MDCSFQELVNLEKLENLLNSFYKITGVTSFLIDNQNIIVASAGFQEICRDFYKNNPEANRICIESNAYLLSCLKEGKSEIYKCPHGLVKMATPIFIGGEQLASFLIAQFFVKAPDLDFYKDQAEKYGFQFSTFWEALLKVPIYSREKACHILNYYADLAMLLGESGLKNQYKLSEKDIQAQEEQRKSQERLLTIIDSLDAHISVVDIKTCEIIYTNKNGQELWGDVIGRKCWEVFRENQAGPCDSCPHKELMNSESFPSAVSTFEIYNHDIDRWYECRKKLMTWLDGRLVDISFNLDITERKKMQEEVLKANKLESIGLLAGGIAHDFNNLLSVIWGNISLVSKDIDEDSPVQQRLKNVEKAVYQARDLTNQLQTFAKGGAPVKEAASITDLIREVASFTLSGSKVEYQLSFPPELSYVSIDQGQISQVVHNIILNSLQAMPQGGTIYIYAENMEIGEKDGKEEVSFLEKGAYVKLKIQDDGVGIPQEHIQKLFDPFFTTKVEGTGMGLATSYSIIKRHGGEIRAESIPGEGTTFYVYLPVTYKKTLAIKGVEEKLYQGRGKILVMDDEESIRDLAKEMLDILGYEAEVARDGLEAVELYKKAWNKGEAFEAVILDLTVPGSMGGGEAAQKILEENPRARLIVSSGYSKDLEYSCYEEMGFAGNIAKPYKIEKLSEVIKEVIDAKGRSDPSCP